MPIDLPEPPPPPHPADLISQALADGQAAIDHLKAAASGSTDAAEALADLARLAGEGAGVEGD
ncbi:hypothetical protein [Caulobacter sp. NIBR1757]|uniref:hypothetical protein n=1 Tax=Caulobacter sp. NIBR1757 TaxID=3016000 RepID=UPI0022F002E5|nr:hypothetical protein [Caulobacter sp. NIBR1757]WGM40309.1 hypothetical protein AMEJIAPC_03253 [Caulobacter sp. NIBR1757]